MKTKNKLWILRPVANLKNDESPWEPWYDKAFGFVVAAPDEATARAIADREAGDENTSYNVDGTMVKIAPWLNPRMSTCKELSAEDYVHARVIIKDFAAA